MKNEHRLIRTMGVALLCTIMLTACDDYDGLDEDMAGEALAGEGPDAEPLVFRSTFDVYDHANANLSASVSPDKSRGTRLRVTVDGSVRTITMNQSSRNIFLHHAGGTNQSNLGFIEIGGDDDAADEGDVILIRDTVRSGFLCAEDDEVVYANVPVLHNCLWTMTVHGNGDLSLLSYEDKWLSAHDGAVHADQTVIGTTETFAPSN